MTVTDLRIPAQRRPGDDDMVTLEAGSLSRLRLMLKDPAEQDNWPEIEQAIAYLTGVPENGPTSSSTSTGRRTRSRPAP